VARDFALLVLRLTGLYLAWGHGWGKVVALATGEGDRFVEAVGAMGFPVPIAFAWAAALSELVGGLCVALGLFTPVAAGAAAVTMFVAAFLRHQAHRVLLVNLGVSSYPEDHPEGWGSPELAFVFLLCFVAIALLGPGSWSLDRLWRGRGGSRRRR